MALSPIVKWFKHKNPLILIGCFVLAVSFFSFQRPIYIAIYKWKEPHFITPLYLKDDSLVLRNDQWGVGHFGAKRKDGRLHKGIDIAADIGTIVYAAKSGKAVCFNEPTGMGKYIKIMHPDGFSTIYGHLKDWLIKSNSRVRQGQIIGLTGKSGNANIRGIDSHLHFEIRNGDRPVDPLRHIK